MNYHFSGVGSKPLNRALEGLGMIDHKVVQAGERQICCSKCTEDMAEEVERLTKVLTMLKNFLVATEPKIACSQHKHRQQKANNLDRMRLWKNLSTCICRTIYDTNVLVYEKGC